MDKKAADAIALAKKVVTTRPRFAAGGLSRRGFLGALAGAPLAAKAMTSSAASAPQVDIAKELETILSQRLPNDHRILSQAYTPDEVSNLLETVGRKNRNLSLYEAFDPEESLFHGPSDDETYKVYESAKTFAKQQLENKIGSKISDDDFEKHLKVAAKNQGLYDEALRQADALNMQIQDGDEDFHEISKSVLKKIAEKEPEKVLNSESIDDFLTPEAVAEHHFGVPKDKIDAFLNEKSEGNIANQISSHISDYLENEESPEKILSSAKKLAKKNLTKEKQTDPAQSEKPNSIDHLSPRINAFLENKASQLMAPDPKSETPVLPNSPVAPQLEQKPESSFATEDEAYNFLVNGNKPIAKAAGGSITDNPNFKNWFGESKVVDENGKPRVAYKGMRALDDEGNQIDKIKSPEAEYAGFFSDDPHVANRFAYIPWNAKSFRHGIDDPGSSSVFPVHLKIEKPYIIDAKGKHAASVQFNSKADGWDATEYRNALKDDKFDGIIIKNTKDEGTIFIPKKPHQIKSAIGNEGTFNPNDPRINKAEGGSITDDQPMPSQPANQSQQPAPTIVNDLGHYSEAIEQLKKLPQQKGTVGQFKKAIASKVSPEEFKWSNFDEKFPDEQAKVDKSQLIGHFTQNLPKLKETVKKQTGSANYDDLDPDEQQEKFYDLVNAASKNENIYNSVFADQPRNQFVPYSSHQNEDQIWSHLHDNAEYLLEHLSKNDKTSNPKYSDYQSPGGQNYREILLHVDHPETQYQSSHWDEPNVLAHLRLNDRMGPNGEKLLHAEEVQSDWGQDARMKGLKDRKIEEASKNAEKSFADLQSAKERYEEAKKGSDANLIEKAQEDWYSAGRRHNELVDFINENYSKVAPAPFIHNTSKWTELAMKRLLKEAAEGNYDGVTLSSGDEQKQRWRGAAGADGLKSFYDDVLPKTLEKVAKTHDKDARVTKTPDQDPHLDSASKDKIVEMARSYSIHPTEAMSWWLRLPTESKQHLLPDVASSQKDPSRPFLPITPVLKASVKRGQRMFKDGGKVNASPTAAQIEAGNYKKRHETFQGLNIAIENEKGSTRSGADANGRRWSVKMPAAYGYIKGSVGADKDHVDCYVGNRQNSPRAFIINQLDLKTGKFDEHKCMLGFSNKAEAEKTYIAGFSDGKGRQRIGSIHELSMPEFKAWLKTGKTKTPFTRASEQLIAQALRATNGNRSTAASNLTAAKGA